MNETVFKITFGTLWFIYILVRAPFDIEYKKQEKVKTIKSKSEKFLLLLLALGLLLIPLIWMLTLLLDGFKIGLPVWVRSSGIVISMLSLFYFRRIHKTLGLNWSPTLEIRKDHQLIKSGPYKRIRHPMYAQMWLWVIAQVLIVSNLVAGFSGIIACTLFYFIRIKDEEKMMSESFGDEYVEYTNQTGRLFPKFRQLGKFFKKSVLNTNNIKFKTK